MGSVLTKWEAPTAFFYLSCISSSVQIGSVSIAIIHSTTLRAPYAFHCGSLHSTKVTLINLFKIEVVLVWGFLFFIEITCEARPTTLHRDFYMT